MLGLIYFPAYHIGLKELIAAMFSYEFLLEEQLKPESCLLYNNLEVGGRFE